MMGKKFKKICAFVSILVPAVAHCEISEEVLCFDSSGAGSRNFGLHILHADAAKWSGAFVKYRDAKSAITLVLKSEDAEEIASGRPNQVTTTWYEVYGAKITGEYEMVSQGANVYSMTYESYGSHKKMAFLFNPWALDKNGGECIW
ncbi:hypothetical protein [Burkholderia pseudomultivorans]|uniref:hypothetical protein n=1 Tax=Burkholderia pseudomultivorans TaxID=1207504 RepID=UPI0012D8634F|nr:hypothetical protein [Burkholderia pseudomultivorans]